MTVLVTGSAGHLGEACMRLMRARGVPCRGMDLKASAYTDVIGSVADEAMMRREVGAANAVIHTATLHKPHVATHSRQQFVDTNISGTLAVLEAAAEADVPVVMTSTTSVYGHALRPAPGEPAAWIDETVTPRPRNIYSMTKRAAEDLCELFARRGAAVLVLRMARFFPEDDDSRAARDAFDQENLKVNELLYRRVDIADGAEACLLAVANAPAIGFDRFVISATTPFGRGDAEALGRDPGPVLARLVPEFADLFRERGWRLPERFDRVYDNALARDRLGWAPAHDFRSAVAALAKGERPFSALTYEIGAKGYHDRIFEDGPFPVEEDA